MFKHKFHVQNSPSWADIKRHKDFLQDSTAQGLKKESLLCIMQPGLLLKVLAHKRGNAFYQIWSLSHFLIITNKSIYIETYASICARKDQVDPTRTNYH